MLTLRSHQQLPSLDRALNFFKKTYRFPKRDSAKNKSAISGVSFEPNLVAALPPHSPRKTPQIDHQNTTLWHPFLSKPPAKRRNTTAQKNMH
jgi:hypothetical protein